MIRGEEGRGGGVRRSEEYGRGGGVRRRGEEEG